MRECILVSELRERSALKFYADLACTVRSTHGKYETAVVRVPVLRNTHTFSYEA